MKFTVDNGENTDKAYWWLHGDNGEMVAWSGEDFASISNAKRAAEAFKVGAAEARYDIYEDAAKEWRWRAWRSSDVVASSGESFASKSNAERAAENVQANAGDADGPE